MKKSFNQQVNQKKSGSLGQPNEPVIKYITK